MHFPLIAKRMVGQKDSGSHARLLALGSSPSSWSNPGLQVKRFQLLQTLSPWGFGERETKARRILVLVAIAMAQTQPTGGKRVFNLKRRGTPQVFLFDMIKIRFLCDEDGSSIDLAFDQRCSVELQFLHRAPIKQQATRAASLEQEQALLSFHQQQLPREN